MMSLIQQIAVDQFKKYEILTLPCLYILGVAWFVQRHLHLFVLASDASGKIQKDKNNLSY